MSEENKRLIALGHQIQKKDAVERTKEFCMKTIDNDYLHSFAFDWAEIGNCLVLMYSMCNNQKWYNI